jgi:DNA-binding transcriptional LysR family regulator
MVAAAVDGVGLANAIKDRVEEHISAGRLLRLLADWRSPFPWFFLYYASFRQMPAALRALIDFPRVGD